MFEKLTELFLKYDHEIVKLTVNLILAILIFIVGSYLSKLCGKLLDTVLNGRNVDPTLVTFSGSLLKNVILALTIIAVLGRLGLETTSFVAIIGAAGLAIGLALQGSLANFAAGVLLIIFRPFKVGDLVDVSISGVVESIQIFSTVIKVGDGRIVVIPNSKISSGNIINYTRDPDRRIDLIIGVAYDTKLETVKQILVNSVRRTDNMLLDKPIVVRLEELGPSSINFAVRAWVTNANYFTSRSALLENIKQDLDSNHIAIPYPTYDVNVKQPSSPAAHD